jgi:hypothetical protein
MATTSISITPQFGNNTVTEINCGSSSPRLSGTIDLSAFPNLTGFRCINNHITAISGYENNANLTFINLGTNKITGNLPSFAGTPNLGTAVYSNNLYSGTIQNYNSQLKNFQCLNNNLSGRIPDLTNTNGWTNFLVHDNNLTGPIPPSLSNQVAMLVFSCYSNPLTGSIPNINSCTKLQRFLLASCNLTGSIPNLTNNVDLTECWFHNNLLTGSIPSLSANTELEKFFCYNQRGTTSKLSGFAGGSVSNTLGEFQAQNNQLTRTTVNTILSTFDATTRTADPRILILGGTGNFAPSYTGGFTTTLTGSNFTTLGTTVTANVTNHNHPNGSLVTITGLQSVFTGTFAISSINANQFRYTVATDSPTLVTGTGTATMRRTTNANDGFRFYQNLARFGRLATVQSGLSGFPWDVTVNLP